jgi:hypothetical protein
MKTRIFKLILCISALLFSLSCKKPFEHDAISDSATLLVVEGVINQGGQTNIVLSRTLKLSDKSVVQMEKGAKVQVEGSNNSILLSLKVLPGFIPCQLQHLIRICNIVLELRQLPERNIFQT